ncbi:hypothetical protein [Micromonospora zingiberis]|uniref:hypothetical protein n=1 Tax=Micromonospora zingiberis TaxID=2053011 RepID=UPI0019801133|nr:hypothetical protein [Micromonospora zingiberis]
MNYLRIPILALTAAAVLTAALHPAPALSARTDRWHADLSALDTDDVDVRHTPTGLRLADARPPAALTYRAYATRIGLVGNPTANGPTVVRPRHSYALASGEYLSHASRWSGAVRCRAADRAGSGSVGTGPVAEGQGSSSGRGARTSSWYRGWQAP